MATFRESPFGFGTVFKVSLAPNTFFSFYLRRGDQPFPLDSSLLIQKGRDLIFQ
jgi:hypothetical protein